MNRHIKYEPLNKSVRHSSYCFFFLCIIISKHCFVKDGERRIKNVKTYFHGVFVVGLVVKIFVFKTKVSGFLRIRIALKVLLTFVKISMGMLPSPEIRSTGGRYAFYWNVFLFCVIFTDHQGKVNIVTGVCSQGGLRVCVPACTWEGGVQPDMPLGRGVCG